ncbi:MAG: Gfo/Idh/MocA family protein [Thermoguttaceae bacterium]
MSCRMTRRELLRTAGWGAAGWWILPNSRSVWSYQANQKLAVALVGLGKRGMGFVQSIPRVGQEVVALCDANNNRVAEALKRLPQAVQYQDFRKMLDQMDRKIDAAIVATPDHTHAVIAAAAIRRGKHVYVEKPIAHDVSEARTLRHLAQQGKVATQMGNQGMATDSFRRTLELIQEGAVGEIREVHAWYVFGGSGPLERPKDTEPVPPGLDWDLWLGPASWRPYHSRYLQGWGAWRDFGTGVLGGGGSHSINLAFKALNLRALWDGGQYPGTIRVEPEMSERCLLSFPRWEILRYDFPARGPLPPARLNFYAASEPDLKRLGIWDKLEKIAGRPLEWKDSSWTPRSGTLLVGSKAVVHTNAHNSVCALLPEGKFPDAGGPPRRLPRAPTAGEHGLPGHEREWIRACQGGPTPFSNFDHSGPAIELLLLGNVATLVGQPLEFDPVGCKIPGNAEADALLRPEHRQGWTL